MNKKALELSINFLVIVIISLVILSAGILLIKKYFAEAEELHKEISQETEIQINENTPLSKILEQAMVAEKAAQEFYESLSGRFEENSKIESTLRYFATMELGHYKLLEIEKDNVERFEEADVYWPMVHVGP